MLRIEKLAATPLPALSFELADGECLAVEGPSGSGKTRLLRAIADLDPAPGRVFLDGIERNEFTGPQWRSRVRYCAAEPSWWTDTPRAALGMGEADVGDAGKWRQRLLSMLALSPVLVDRPIAQLSTGERHRLALVRGLIDDPRVVLLDEPTSALDQGSAALVEELVRYLLLSGRSVVLVSHDPRQVQRLAHARLQLSGLLPDATSGQSAELHP